MTHNDVCSGPAGRSVLHTMYIFHVKSPAERKYRFDYYDVFGKLRGRRRVFIHCAIIAKPPQTHSAYVKLAAASLLMTCRQPSSLSAPTERNARLSRFFCMSDTFFSIARPRSVR